VPAGLAWAPNGTDLLVTLSANNTLAVVDTTTNTVVKQIPVGNVPNSVVVIDGKAYVSNQGGRPAQAGDKTDDSYGTGIVRKRRTTLRRFAVLRPGSPVHSPVDNGRCAWA
jgi:YVTN family beta-propeller protein